ncbi:MAG: hypothetical protein ACI8WM_000382 [Burkholderiaceae bacterium]|jgi:hypothetical protein
MPNNSTSDDSKSKPAQSMNTLQFLQAVEPTEDVHYVALMQAGKPGVSHHPYTSLEDMAAAVIEFDKKPDITVFHACATYREPFINEDGRKKYRVPANSKAAKAFWIDIDCGDEKAADNKGYATKNAAGKAILGFCQKAGFPAPLIIDSGNGLHCYWLLTESISSDEWKATAELLKSVLRHFGVLADPSRTADFASILRPVGTHNKKDPNNHKLVKVLREGQTVDVSVIKAALSDIVSKFDVVLPKPNPVRGTVADINDDLTAHAYPEVPAHFDLIAAKCNQVKILTKTGYQGNEPGWKAVIGAVVKCVDGAEKIHQYSSIDPGYNRAETQRKIDSCIDKPTTCKHIESCNPAGCEGCLSKDRITAPLQLGRTAGNDGIGNVDEAEQTNVALAAVQQDFAMMTAGSGVSIVDLAALKRKQEYGAAASLVLLRRPDGMLLIQRYLKLNFPALNPKDCMQRFPAATGTTLYDSVDFRPGMGRPGSLNLWVGPTLIPMQGKWSTLEEFLLNTICGNDKKIYAYLIRYLAHALQFPEQKPGVMITLIGGQGIGKGTLFALITKIWSATTLLTSRIADVVGDFNDALERCMFILLDEPAIRDEKNADSLKSLATNLEVRINPKGQPARTITSVHRIINATNHSHGGRREHDDRRDLTLKVSEHRKGDIAYWMKVYSAVETETAALMYDLMALDLSDFNVRQKPDTGELTKQKVMSLPIIDAFWHDCLYGGALPLHNTWPTFVSTKSVVEAIKDFAKGGRNFAPISANAVTTAIKRLCPQAQSAQCSEGAYRHRGFNLPSLEECRIAFETFIGGKVEW